MIVIGFENEMLMFWTKKLLFISCIVVTMYLILILMNQLFQ